MLRAVSIVRGQWLGRADPHAGGSFTLVRVPATYAEAASAPNCFAFRQDQPASCAPHLKAASQIVTIATPVGRYPPLYYLLVGWPSLLTDRVAGFYLMRIVSVLVSAAFLAMAVAIAYRWSRRRLLVAGITVAMTPMTIFLSSTINPSGLEIASAIAVWTAAIVLVDEHASWPPKPLVALLAAATMVLISIRGAGPLWPVLILVVLFPLMWRRLPLEVLLSRWVLGWAAALILVAAVDTAWILGAHALRLQPVGPVPPAFNSTTGLVRLILGSTSFYLETAIGTFGWLDTPSPWVTTTVWYVVAGALILFSLMWSSARRWVSLLLASTFSLLFPLIFQMVEAHKVGLLGQGRYFLPIYVGVPLLAAATAFDDAAMKTPIRRACLAIGVAVGVGQFAAFAWALRRYVVGFNGPIFHGLGPGHTWQPPLPWQVLDGAALVLCALLALAISKRGRYQPVPA